MKAIVLYCPSCGARLDVDLESKTASCQYCGARIPVSDETQRLRIDGASHAGYEFEEGRLRAQEDERLRREAVQRAQVDAQVQAIKEKQKKKQTLILWVLGWLLFWPAPLSVLVYRAFRKGGLSKGASCAIVAGIWGLITVLLLIGAIAYGTSDAYKAAASSSESAAVQEKEPEKGEDTATQETESAKSDDAATQEKEPEKSDDAASAEAEQDKGNDVMVLKANVPGEYGRTITLYGGGSETDTSTRLGWFVPEGKYSVKNLDYTGMWEQVNYGLPDPLTNDSGFLESSQFVNLLVKPGESVVIYVLEGECIYITGDTGKLELTKIG